LPEIIEFAGFLKKEGYEKVSILGYCWGTSELSPSAPIRNQIQSNSSPSPFASTL